jgi:hypothetical protein
MFFSPVGCPGGLLGRLEMLRLFDVRVLFTRQNLARPDRVLIEVRCHDFLRHGIP